VSLPLEHDWGDQALDLGGLELLLLALHNRSSLAKERTKDNFMGIGLNFWGFTKICKKPVLWVRNPELFLTPGSGMGKKSV
jgi:hypothetical protein